MSPRLFTEVEVDCGVGGAELKTGDDVTLGRTGMGAMCLGEVVVGVNLGIPFGGCGTAEPVVEALP